MRKRINSIGGYSAYVTLPKDWVKNLPLPFVEIRIEGNELILSPVVEDEHGERKAVQNEAD